MKNGDTIEVEIEGVGTLSNPIANEKDFGANGCRAGGENDCSG